MSVSDRTIGGPDTGAAYRSTRLRLTALLSGEPADVSAQPVPACPGWDVHDVVAHLVGIVEDALAGRLSGRADGPDGLFVFGPRSSALCE